MTASKYLNTVLTAIALLLALNLYAGWMASPGGDLLTVSQEASAQGLTNAGAQRKQMIDQLKLVNVKLDAMTKTMTNGKLRVKLESNPDGDKK